MDRAAGWRWLWMDTDGLGRQSEIDGLRLRDADGRRRTHSVDGVLLTCMIVSFCAIAAAVHQQLGRVDGDTDVRGNFSGTLIAYASPAVALSLALAFAYVLVREVLAPRLANLRVTGRCLAFTPAVHLPVVAARAEIEQPQAGSAALLTERLHLGARGGEKLARHREGDEPAFRSGAVFHHVCRAEAPRGILGASRLSRGGSRAIYTAPGGSLHFSARSRATAARHFTSPPEAGCSSTSRSVSGRSTPPLLLGSPDPVTNASAEC